MLLLATIPMRALLSLCMAAFLAFYHTHFNNQHDQEVSTGSYYNDGREEEEFASINKNSKNLRQQQQQHDNSNSNNNKVKVLVAMESLCIDSKNFVNDHLVPTYRSLREIMDLRVVMFGNAKIVTGGQLDDDDEGTITCQHGNAECDANSYEQCAAYEYRDVDEDDPNRYYLPFVQCLFNSLTMGYRAEPFDRTPFAKCAYRTGLAFDSVLAPCHDNATLAWELQSEAFAATPARHDHVPWVEVNGAYMNEDTTDFKRRVCDAYRERSGGARFPACDDDRDDGVFVNYGTSGWSRVIN